MKKNLLTFICLVMMLFMLPITAFADPGEGNIDGGGGGLGDGTGSNIWMPGDDGVRVTVIRDSDNAPVSTPIDYTNITPANNIMHFGKVSKIGYRNCAALMPQIGGYVCVQPSIAIPRIISSSSLSASIDEIKQYFCSEYAAELVANNTGINYVGLMSGEYKLLLEPIAYFTFNGTNVSMTATEAAMYDMQLGGDLRSEMGSLTHKNLPFAMILEMSDLGYPAWNGSTGTGVNNDQIISSLGLGIVRYKDRPPDPKVGAADQEYRTDTEVITPVTLSTGSRLTPDNPAQVTFSIMGSTYTMSNIVIPAGGSQVVWCKWRTPSTPQTVTIQVRSDSGSLSNTTITAKIIDLNQNPPPNPTARDRNDNYTLPSVPSKPQQFSASWTVWRCYWESKWVKVWHTDSNGSAWYEWVDMGDWKYTSDSYSASLSATGPTKPDDKAVTANGKTMKSGYGINIDINARVATNAPDSHTTWAQNAVAYFPEFSYNTYWRLLDRIVSGYNATLELKPNKYSTYNRRVHFTPPWFPDAAYTTYTQVMDAWTPAGMLNVYVNDYVNIKQSVFDDWHIAPKK
ncbi:hypothetical protein [Desulfosporosinus lacus]|uniref:Uncharacterized protein n=1 Tax=Desulfosporosinus lacus DSM 15449 TaxID=1121420 RepID=A0A1M5V304_9FIRM|nr:hypothetical protein [Desulfosporosinus lacus]SHH69647.1 hypothetical protein SAMN02746098_01178 [Desulfosporosinus lacus DSM 15449]